jgi:hypothetical protein
MLLELPNMTLKMTATSPQLNVGSVGQTGEQMTTTIELAHGSWSCSIIGVSSATTWRGIERCLIVLGAVTFGYFGFRLYLNGVANTPTKLDMDVPVAKFALSGGGPGIAFMAFGSVLREAWDGRPIGVNARGSCRASHPAGVRARIVNPSCFARRARGAFARLRAT